MDLTLLLSKGFVHRILKGKWVHFAFRQRQQNGGRTHFSAPQNCPGTPPNHSGTPLGHSAVPPKRSGAPPNDPGVPPNWPGVPPNRPGTPPNGPDTPPNAPDTPLNRPETPLNGPDSRDFLENTRICLKTALFPPNRKTTQQTPFLVLRRIRLRIQPQSLHFN
jgi:hypothetical protein